MFRSERIQLISDIVKSEYKKIEVVAGTCRYNFHCHSNSVHDAINSNHENIGMVIYFDNGYPIVHFINFDGENYIDNTLGQWSQKMEYYLVRHITKSEFWDVYKIHESLRKTIKNKLPFIYRIFHDVNFI